MINQFEQEPRQTENKTSVNITIRSSRHWNAVASLLLAAITFLLYCTVGNHAFINYDDHQYVIDNSHVTTGLSWSNLVWAFTTGYAANWHPLTWITHQLDATLFGLNPGPQHLINAALHSLNASLLFLVLHRFTDAWWRSLVVAGLFAWHPEHVESVAWISERKDVLSAFFWMLALLAYHRYFTRPSWRNYGLVALALCGGLMSKPMVVTLPCVFLLLDYWPLRRLETKMQWKRVIAEKIPLLVLSAVACAVTFMVQHTGGAVVSLQQSPLSTRLATALLTVFFYLGKTFWPADLFLPYWYEFKAALWPIAAAILGFAAITGICLKWGVQRKYLPVGWFWFLGTLVPVIGLVQVGSQSAADRYTYLPSIGLFIAVIWAAADLAAYFKLPRMLRHLGAAAVLITCGVLTTRQIGYWKNSVALFEHTVAVDPPNLPAIDLLAWTFATDLDPRIRDGQRAVQLSSLVAQITEGHEPAFLKTLAAAYAEAHDFPRAVKVAEDAIQLAEKAGQPQLAKDIQLNLDLYRAGRAIHQP